MEKRMPSRRKSRATKRRTFDVINPATGKALASYPIATAPQVRAKVEAAREAFRTWSRLDPKERAAYLLRFAEILRKHKDAYAETMTLEMGKVIREAIAEVEKCAWAAEYFGENGPAFLQPELVATDAMRSYIAFHPRGVLGSIMPWNFPMWQIVRFAVPALIAGNTVVVKPASASPQSGCNLEIAFREAGLPHGVFQIVVGDRTTATALIHSPVSVVSLTGSVRTGVYVAREASKDLKKVVLELGGSDPFIVAGDADLDAAAKGAVAGRFVNGGQSCIAAKRFFVVDSVASEFVAKFAELVKRLRVGDPRDPTTDVGPLVSKTQRDEIESQVKDAIAKGANVEVGGKRPRREGWYFEPTLLSHVTKDMRVLREETFGPVAPVMAVPSLRAAIDEANDSVFGLGASLWTRNLGQADELAAQVESGMVFINGVVKSDPRMPFGGVKHSGVGRELSRYGLLEMVNIKTVEIFPGHSGQAAIQKNTE
ncbi:MAG TPA: NAD-dependent succinate-semialdehyde dehydrogenase [Thermoplasmata archaeon]|nr:NAD-dependent succinate-semialdehyde dehydrogenase [Thermoplasmata archaeon]